jgi:hypothetical protein
LHLSGVFCFKKIRTSEFSAVDVSMDEGTLGAFLLLPFAFGKKNLSGKKNNGGFQFQPISHRRNDLGPAEKLTISVPNYRDLRKTKKLTLDRPKSHYKITLTLVDEACPLSSLKSD